VRARPTGTMFRDDEEIQRRESRLHRVFIGAVLMFVISVVLLQVALPRPEYAVSFFQGVALWLLVVMVYAFTNLFKDKKSGEVGGSVAIQP